MKQVKSSMRRAYFPFAVIGLFSVVFYIMTYYTIPIEEDMEYGLTGFLRRHGLSNNYNFAGMWNHIMHLYRDCNGRLIDKLPVPILVLCPKWLFAIFNVGVVWLIVGASYKLMALAIGGTWNRKPLCTSFMGFISKYPWHASAFVFLMMMFFPWHTKMLTVSYSLGYIWTSAIALWLVYYFCNSRLIGGSKILLAFVLIGCVLSGILHELLPCVLCSAFLIPALCSGNRMLIWRRLGIIASLFIGYLVLSHTVGHIYRVSYYDIHFDWRRICSTYRGLMPSSSVMQSIVFFLTLAVFFICRVKILSFAEILKSLKRSFYPLREHTPLWTVIITLVGGCITSIVIFGFFDNAARIMSYAILFSFIGGLILLVRWPGGLPHWFCRVLQGCIIAVALCGLAVWTVSCFVQNKIFKAFNIAEKLIYESG